jgi:hypothetical protein
MYKLFILSTIILFGTLMSNAQSFLQSPIEGTQGEEWIIVNYVDWDTSAGFQDHNCGTKSYDGHQGTDFTIPSFKQMDAGVKVYAAASGRVTFTKDGEFDRETAGDVSKLLGNYVAIQHPNKYYTYYGHLRKNSILVAEGDSVTAGDIIGYVGSSGNSTDPHLHFEVWYDSLYVVDPFSGTCGNLNSLFNDPAIYDNSFKVWDSGLHLKNDLTINDLRERITTLEKPYTLTPSSDSSLNFWTHLLGLKKGKELSLTWYTPTATEWFNYTFTLDQDYWYYYYFSYINHQDLAEGEWTVELEYDGNKVVDENFNVSKTANQENSSETNLCNDYSKSKLTELWANPQLEVNVYDMQGKSVEAAYPISPGIYSIIITDQNGLCTLKRALQ